MTFNEAWKLIKAAGSSWIDDYAPSMGAALAYYTVFSVAPLLLIVISIAGLVFGEEAARGEIVAQLQGMMGNEAAQAVEGLVQSVSKPAKGVFATVLGVVLLLVGATTVFGELQDALDRIWRAPARKTSGLWGLLRTRVLSFGLILGVGFLLIASLVVSAALSALGKWWAPLFGGWEVLAQLVNFIISFALVTAIFAMIYKIMPRVHIKWHDVWIGAAVTSLLFTIGKFLISLYVGKSGVTSGFGAAGSLVVLLVWVYYSAQIFLMGAEFTWVYAHEFGSLKGQPIPPRGEQIPSASSQSADGAGGDRSGDKAGQEGDRAGTAGAAGSATPQPSAAGHLAALNAGKPLPAGGAAAVLPLAVAPTPALPPPRTLAEYVQRDPLKGVGIGVAAGFAVRMLWPLAARLALRRAPRRS